MLRKKIRQRPRWMRLILSLASTLFFSLLLPSVALAEGEDTLHSNLDPTLLGSWDFDDPADLGFDASASGRHGLVNGTAAQTAGPGGRQALVLDGSTFLEIPNLGQDLVGLEELTVMAWIRVDQHKQVNVLRSQQPFAFSSRGLIVANYLEGGGWHTLDTPVEPPVDEWYHLAAVFERGEMRVFLNRQRVATRTVPFTALQGSSHPSWTIGARLVGQAPDQFFAGAIDELRFYERALADEEITAVAPTSSASHWWQDRDHDASSPLWWTLSPTTTGEELRAELLDTEKHRARFVASGSDLLGETDPELVEVYIDGAETPELIPFWRALSAFAHRFAAHEDARQRLSDEMAAYGLSHGATVELFDARRRLIAAESHLSSQLAEAAGDHAELAARAEAQIGAGHFALALENADAESVAAASGRSIEESRAFVHIMRRDPRVESTIPVLRDLEMHLAQADWQALRSYLLNEVADEIRVVGARAAVPTEGGPSHLLEIENTQMTVTPLGATESRVIVSSTGILLGATSVNGFSQRCFLNAASEGPDVLEINAPDYFANPPDIVIYPRPLTRQSCQMAAIVPHCNGPSLDNLVFGYSQAALWDVAGALPVVVAYEYDFPPDNPRSLECRRLRTVGGELELPGLAAHTVQLTNRVTENGRTVRVDALSVTGERSFTFPPVADGESFEITYSGAASAETLHCSVENGSGTIQGFDRLDVRVSCECANPPLCDGDADTQKIGGLVRGLAQGETVSLAAAITPTGGSPYVVSRSNLGNTSFTFPGEVQAGWQYLVQIQQQPTAGTCSIQPPEAAGGEVPEGESVTDIVVDCFCDEPGDCDDPPPPPASPPPPPPSPCEHPRDCLDFPQPAPWDDILHIWLDFKPTACKFECTEALPEYETVFCGFDVPTADDPCALFWGPSYELCHAGNNCEYHSCLESSTSGGGAALKAYLPDQDRYPGPRLDVDAASNLGFVDGKLLVDDQFYLSCTASDAAGVFGFLLARNYEVIEERVLTGEPSTGNVHSVVDTSDWPEGEYTLQVLAVSADPRAHTPSLLEIAVVVDHQPPVPSCANDTAGPSGGITWPLDGAVLEPGTVAIAAQAGDPYGMDKVRFLVDGETRHVDRAAPFGYADWLAEPGQYELELHLFDNCGNSTVSEAIDVTVQSVDPDIAVERIWTSQAVSDDSVVDLGIETPIGVADSRGFRLRNLGAQTLFLENAADLLADSPCLHLVETPEASIAPGASTHFRVRVLCGQVDEHSAAISIASNDPNEDPFAFTVKGTVTGPQPPQLHVERLWTGVEISHGELVDLELATPAGQAASRGFVLRNDGDLPLRLEAPADLLGGSSCLQLVQPPAAAVPPGGSTTFRIRLHCLDEGTHTAQVMISSNDPADNPFLFSTEGTVTAAPQPDIRVEEVWTSNEVMSGTTVDLGIETPAGYAASRAFRLVNTGDTALTISDPGAQVGASPCFRQIESPLAELHPGASTHVRVRVHCHQVGLHTTTLSIASNDPDESPYAFSIQARVLPPLPPEIAVSQLWDGGEVASGDTVDLGLVTPPGTAASRAFWIDNHGASTLEIDNAGALLSGSPCFQLIEVPAATLEAGERTHFRVRLHCQDIGTHSATVTIENNDPNEDPFTFVIEGEVGDGAS